MQKQSLSILEKIMYPLGGFLIGTLLMLTGLKITGTYWGIFLGMLADGGFGWYLLTKYPKQPDKKLIAYGIIGAIILIAIGGVGIWIFANILMSGISG